MVVRYTLPNGREVHGPPYTKAEIREMRRRIQNGPRMMVMPGRAIKAQELSGSTNQNNPATSQSAVNAADHPAPPKDLP